MFRLISGALTKRRRQSDAPSTSDGASSEEQSSSNVSGADSSEQNNGMDDKGAPVQKTESRKTTAITKTFIRDRLIFKEINDENLARILPTTCKLVFENPDELHNFKVEVCPEDGFWSDGKFVFSVNVTEEYNFEPPKVKCLTKIWHPNIDEDGAICLSILRASGIDENGWNPARQLKDVIFGINSLFTDLLNFHDPLNARAAEMYQRNPEEFQELVLDYIKKYAQK